MKVVLVLISILALSQVYNCGWGDKWPFCLNPNYWKSDMMTNQSPVSLSKYAGVWHEQWHILPSFLPQQNGCVCTQVNYILNDDGELVVRNRCANEKNNLKWGGIDGHLVVNDSPQNTKGTVYFFEKYIGRHTIPYLTGSYWILDLDPDYQWALVGEPCKQSAYFLTRERKVDEALVNKSLEDLKNKWEYKTFSDLEHTKQENCPEFPGWDESVSPVGVASRMLDNSWMKVMD